MKVTKAELVEAARELFREKGYAGASMQDLAERVGLRKASLYMRFPNKEALVPEVLDLTLKETFNKPAGQSDENWESEYEGSIRVIAATLSDRRRCVGLHLAYGVGNATPVAKDAVRAFFRAHIDCLSAILSRAMSTETAEHLAIDALAHLEGATLFSTVFGDHGAMDRAVIFALREAREAAALP